MKIKKAEERSDVLNENKNIAERENHLRRYHYASLHINSLKQAKCSILDVACGLGYGTQILRRKTSSHATGMDIDPQSVKHATKHYSEKEINFICGSITKIEYPNNHFDFITSFETIEHLGLIKAKQALDELHRVLKIGGYLFLSTPNRNWTRFIHIYKPNPYHIYEFTPKELTKILEKSGFKIIKRAGQFFFNPIMYPLTNIRINKNYKIFEPNEKLSHSLSLYNIYILQKI